MTNQELAQRLAALEPHDDVVFRTTNYIDQATQKWRAVNIKVQRPATGRRFTEVTLEEVE